MSTRPSTPEHGYGAYSTGRCRCEKCTALAKKYRREQRKRRLASPWIRHGIRATYDCGCRCELCRTAKHMAYCYGRGGSA